MSHELSLGIDIGGTNTSYGLVDKRGQIIAKNKMRTAGHGAIEDYIAVLKTNVEAMISEAGNPKVQAVGVGVPNANHYTGEVTYAPNLPWKGVIPLAKLVGDALGMRAKINNDANAAALGELAYGAARGMKDFIYVTLGTGLGSGFVANGEMIYGHDGLAGELGHVIAVRDGRKCGCQRNGCLERYASATGIVITAQEWLNERDDDTPLRDKEKLEAKDIQDAARAGDKFALELYDYTGKILGQTLADAVAITSPQAIILFGGLAQAKELITEPTKRYMEENLLLIYRDKIPVLLSELPDADAALLGASAMAW